MFLKLLASECFCASEVLQVPLNERWILSYCWLMPLLFLFHRMGFLTFFNVNVSNWWTRHFTKYVFLSHSYCLSQFSLDLWNISTALAYKGEIGVFLLFYFNSTGSCYKKFNVHMFLFLLNFFFNFLKIDFSFLRKSFASNCCFFLVSVSSLKSCLEKNDKHLSYRKIDISFCTVWWVLCKFSLIYIKGYEWRCMCKCCIAMRFNHFHNPT